MNYCKVCNKQIRFGISLCNECRDKRNYHAAMVSTNKKRLKELLNKRELTKDRLDRFKKQTKTIIQNGEIILEFPR